MEAAGYGGDQTRSTKKQIRNKHERENLKMTETKYSKKFPVSHLGHSNFVSVSNFDTCPP